MVPRELIKANILVLKRPESGFNDSWGLTVVASSDERYKIGDKVAVDQNSPIIERLTDKEFVISSDSVYGRY